MELLCDNTDVPLWRMSGRKKPWITFFWNVRTREIWEKMIQTGLNVDINYKLVKYGIFRENMHSDY